MGKFAELILEFADTDGSFGGDNDKSHYHNQKKAEHEAHAEVHRSKSKNVSDDHMWAARAHSQAGNKHQIAATAHKGDLKSKDVRSSNADNFSKIAHDMSKTANGS
jgi:hypothetical protein